MNFTKSLDFTRNKLLLLKDRHVFLSLILYFFRKKKKVYQVAHVESGGASMIADVFTKIVTGAQDKRLSVRFYNDCNVLLFGMDMT